MWQKLHRDGCVHVHTDRVNNNFTLPWYMNDNCCDLWKLFFYLFLRVERFGVAQSRSVGVPVSVANPHWFQCGSGSSIFCQCGYRFQWVPFRVAVRNTNYFRIILISFARSKYLEYNFHNGKMRTRILLVAAARSIAWAAMWPTLLDYSRAECLGILRGLGRSP